MNYFLTWFIINYSYIILEYLKNIKNMKVEINIEWLLEKKNMKLSDLEKKVSLSYQQLWNIKEWRTTKVSFETIGELLKGFKCKPNDLFKLTK